MDAMIKNGDPGVFYWEPESLAGYDLGAWDRNTNRPTIAMDAFLGIKYMEVSWIMKANVEAPKNGETIISAKDLLMKASVKHVQNKTVQVDFYVDGKKVGTVNTQPYELQAPELKNGIHTLWANAIDYSKNKQATDTITFFVGESIEFDEASVVDEDNKGGLMEWNVNFLEKGKYALLFYYNADKVKGVTMTVDNDSLGRIFFQKGNEIYLTKEVHIKESGNHGLKLTAIYSTGLPSVQSLRIFPLEGQVLPEQGHADNIFTQINKEETIVEIFNLSGQRVGEMYEHQLGVSLGDRESAIVVLPNCVGGTPNIVRKHRLK